MGLLHFASPSRSRQWNFKRNATRISGLELMQVALVGFAPIPALDTILTRVLRDKHYLRHQSSPIGS